MNMYDITNMLRNATFPAFRARFFGLVHQRRFWGNTRGLSANLGRGPKQVEKTHSNPSLATRSIRSGFLFSGFRRWGRLAIRGPFRCKHRIKLRKRRPGHQGPRAGASLPGDDLAGNQIACRLVGDELAHDLDIETLQRLESSLADDLGTMLLVSRARARLNDVAASTLVIEDDGLVKEQQASHDGDLRQRPAEPLGRGVAPC